MYYYIYKITNIHNNKFYIGSHKTPDLEDNYFGSGIYLKRSITKYGKDSFKKEYLMFCKDEIEMKEKETEILQTIKNNNTYNLKFCSMGGNTREKYTQEQKKAYIKKLINNPNSPIGKKNVSAFNYGIKASRETRNKQSASHKERYIKLKKDSSKYSEYKNKITKTSIINLKSATEAIKKPVVIYDNINNVTLSFSSKVECIRSIDIPMSILNSLLKNTGYIKLTDILYKKEQLQQRKKNASNKRCKQRTMYKLISLQDNTIMEFSKKKNIIDYLKLNYDQVKVLITRRIKRGSYQKDFLFIFDNYKIIKEYR
jgi:group I intron endonuclease